MRKGSLSLKTDNNYRLQCRIAEVLLSVCIVAFTLWQGSYFPLQYFLIIALLLLAFAVFGKTLTITAEAVLLCGIVVLYIISLCFISESKYVGLCETLRVLILPLSLILFRSTNHKRVENAIFAALMCIAVLGLLAFASIIYIPGGVDGGSGRLQSVIQYANTTALLMTIGAFYSIHLFISNKNVRHLFCLAVFLCALFLTGSRTTLVVGVGTGSLYAFITAERRGKFITVCALLVAVGVIIALNNLTDIRMFRVSLYEPTLVERWITFQDAIGMVQGRWLPGIGVGNWQEWQLRLQSAPYYVKYIHNYYLQLLLDAGILAPLLLCSAVLPAIFRGIRTKSVHAVILIAVMLHAVLDFDMIFTAVAAISMYSLSRLTGKEWKIHPNKLRFIGIAPCLIVAALWNSETYSAYADARLEDGNLNASMNANTTALALNPLNTDLYYQIAQSTRDIEVTEKYIRLALQQNPKDSRAISILAIIESQKGNHEAALRLCETLIENRRFSEAYREIYLSIAEQAVSDDIITEDEYAVIQARIDAFSQSVNPLYTQYIKDKTEVVEMPNNRSP